MKNAILLAKNQEYVSRKCEKSYFSTIYRISAQNRIRPRTQQYFHREFYTTNPLQYFGCTSKNGHTIKFDRHNNYCGGWIDSPNWLPFSLILSNLFPRIISHFSKTEDHFKHFIQTSTQG